MSKGKWIHCFRPNPHAQTRLVCFHHAGGAATDFYSWRSQLPADVELLIVQLPGRGSRISEPLCSAPDVVIHNLAHALTDYQDKPYTFFGHSLGGRIAHQLVHSLFTKGAPLPLHC